MVRIIKFRAWVDNGETVQMFQFGLFDTDEGYSIRHQQSFDGCPIMQFTGLQDKNGKDIYEGDIVSEGYNNKYGTFPVMWDKCGFNLTTGGDGSFTIIGNIWETPKLIKHGN